MSRLPLPLRLEQYDIENTKMEKDVSENGVLKRKLEVDATLKAPESDLNSPPTKIQATDEKRIDQDPTKGSVLPSTSAPNPTVSGENSGDLYDEREKMQ